MKKITTCSVEGCSKPFLAQGCCSKHYERLRKHGHPLGGSQFRIPKEERPATCGIPGCTLPHYCKNLCASHYQRHRGGRSADLTSPIKQRKQRGLRIDHLGYESFFDPSHPMARGCGNVHVHRAVMMEIIGRPLVKGENVHHKNGNRADNRPENLELWVTLQPSGQRPADLVEYAKVILARYGNLLDRLALPEVKASSKMAAD